MTRTRHDSLDGCGLNWDRLPLKLFAGGNAKFWNPADIDLTHDRADWEALSERERAYPTRLCAEFIVGEEPVTKEGTLALTKYVAWQDICADHGILSGMQEVVRRIGGDERLHMAWGTFTCRRHVATDDANWTAFETRMNELIPLALRITEEAFAPYGDDMPFGLSVDESMKDSSDKGIRRFGSISSARQRPVEEIDVDYSPADQ